MFQQNIGRVEKQALSNSYHKEIQNPIYVLHMYTHKEQLVNLQEVYILHFHQISFSASNIVGFKNKVTGISISHFIIKRILLI